MNGADRAGHLRTARQHLRMVPDPGLLLSDWCVIVYDLQLQLYPWIPRTTASARPSRQ